MTAKKRESKSRDDLVITIEKSEPKVFQSQVHSLQKYNSPLAGYDKSELKSLQSSLQSLNVLTHSN